MKVTIFRTPRGVHLWSVQGHASSAREDAIRQAISFGDKKTAIMLRVAKKICLDSN